MKIVCSGFRFMDIDAYAGCIAYAELLNLLGHPAIAATTAPLNESITATIRSWPVNLKRDYIQAAEDSFILVDISDPEFCDSFVDLNKVEEVIDHHVEFVDYWSQRLGDKGRLEFIGAACTMVYERWVRAGKANKISETSARLLIAGILDNTLNFEADMTTARDHEAFENLMQYANLPDTWPSVYFGECQRSIVSDLAGAIKNDLKTLIFPSLSRKIAVGQLVVWDANEIIRDHINEVRACMNATASEWMISIVSISEKKNYLVAGSNKIEVFLSNLLQVQFDSDIATTERLWLRKEIMKKDIERTK